MALLATKVPTGTAELLNSVKPASTNPAANIQSSVPQSPSLGIQGQLQPQQSQGGQTSQQDPNATLQEAIRNVQAAAGSVQKAQANQANQATLLAVKSELLKNPAIQALMKQQGVLSKQVGDYKGQAAGSADVNPAAQAAVATGDMGNILQGISDAGNDIQTRQTGINTILQTIQATQQKAVDNAQQNFTNQSSLAGLINNTAKTPLELEQLRQSVTGTQPLSASERITNANNLLQSGYITSDQYNQMVNTPQTTDQMRTDRNNNPTAMTTDVARSLGLVEGKDYVQGDKFPGDSNLHTAKLLGDPIETTIRGIDQGGFTTQSGQNRWSYTQSIPGANNADWAKLSQEQKVAVVQQMYKQEGGNGSLMPKSSSSSSTGSPLMNKPFTAKDITDLSLSTGLPVAEIGRYKNLNEFIQAHPNTQVLNANQQNRANALQNVNPILDTYKNLATKINTAPTSEEQVKNMIKNIPGNVQAVLTVQAAIKGMNLNQYLRSFDFNDLPNGVANILTRDDPALAEYAGLKGTLGQLVKAFGDTGQLSEGDLSRARSLLPDPFDSKTTADGKLSQIKDLINKAQGTLTGTYSSGSSSTPSSQSGFNVGDSISIGGQTGKILSIQ